MRRLHGDHAGAGISPPHIGTQAIYTRTTSPIFTSLCLSLLSVDGKLPNAEFRVGGGRAVLDGEALRPGHHHLGPRRVRERARGIPHGHRLLTRLQGPLEAEHEEAVCVGRARGAGAAEAGHVAAQGDPRRLHASTRPPPSTGARASS